MTANHGNTPAAWTGVALILLGFLIGGIGLALESWTVFWVGVAFAPIGAIVGYVMAKMGFGHDPVRGR